MLETFISSILAGGTYAWLAAGLVMVMLEIFLTSNWLLWPGLAAFITSVILYFMPDLPWTGAVVIFVVLSILLLFVGRRYVKIACNAKTDSPNLNARAARMVGRRGSALRDAPDGMSRIQIDGVEWPVRLEDSAAIKLGDVLEITAFDGTTLVAKVIVIK